MSDTEQVLPMTVSEPKWTQAGWASPGGHPAVQVWMEPAATVPATVCGGAAGPFIA